MKKKIICTLKYIVGFYFLSLCVEHYYLLRQSDISLQPVYTSKNHLPVSLVSYASGAPVFLKNQNSQAYSAINKGFNQIFMYHAENIDKAFFEKNKKILSQARGAGYWLWKPYIIAETLKRVPENSIVVYGDSPVVFIKPIDPLLKYVNTHDIILLKDGSFRKKNIRKGGQIIKKEALKKLNLDKDFIRTADAVWACFIIVKNTKQARAFIGKWLELCQNPDLLMDNPLNPNDQYPEFIGHHHDQSLLFLTTQLLPKSIYYIDTDDITGVVKNVHRHPHEESKSLLPDILGIFKISEYGYNSSLFKFLRSF